MTTETVPTGPLAQAVAQMCDGLTSQVSAPLAASISDVRTRLAGPLQLAVAGRIKAGKSTLINALIGRRVAPTDIGECTRVVTRFQYGTVDRVEVIGKDGRRTALPFAPDGGIPADLGMALSEVSHLEAYLTSALLADITVIDTPGLGSLDAASVSRTQQLLGMAEAEPPVRNVRAETHPDATMRLDEVSTAAIAGAEAVVYVFTQSVRADDANVLAAFTAATAAREAGPVNALAVLNKADTVEPDSALDADTWTAACRLAQAQAAVLRPRVAGVLPMIGLLAETAETGNFTTADAQALRSLTAVDPGVFDVMTCSADLFVSLDIPLSTTVRTRLLQLLDLYGIRQIVEQLRVDQTLSPGEIRRRLAQLSGIAQLRDKMVGVFATRIDAIKASAALARLAALAQRGDPGERQRICDAIEVLLQQPAAHQLRLLEALTAVSCGAVTLPEDLTDEVLRLGGSSDPDEQLGRPGAPETELEAVALQRATWWRSYAGFGSTPAQSRIAYVIHRAYFLLWQRLRDGVDP